MHRLHPPHVHSPFPLPPSNLPSEFRVTHESGFGLSRREWASNTPDRPSDTGHREVELKRAESPRELKGSRASYDREHIKTLNQRIQCLQETLKAKEATLAAQNQTITYQ